jgi:hypothetical protein
MVGLLHIRKCQCIAVVVLVVMPFIHTIMLHSVQNKQTIQAKLFIA